MVIYMKIAIVYRGFYKRSGYKLANFNKNFENHKKQIFDKFGRDNCDIYFHTYSRDKESDKELIELLEPKKFRIQTFNGKKILFSIIKSLELVAIPEQYDLIISLRFDLIFLKPIDNFKIQKNKFNLLFREPSNKNIDIVSDLVYFFPPRYLKNLIKTLNYCMIKRHQNSGLFIYPFLINRGVKDTHFLLHKKHNSNTDGCSNGLVKILRTN